MSVFLSLEERRKMAKYLKQECDTARQLIEQMTKINVAKPIIDKRRRELVAMSIVSEMFDQTDVTVI